MQRAPGPSSQGSRAKGRPPQSERPPAARPRLGSLSPANEDLGRRDRYGRGALGEHRVRHPRDRLAAEHAGDERGRVDDAVERRRRCRCRGRRAGTARPRWRRCRSRPSRTGSRRGRRRSRRRWRCRPRGSRRRCRSPGRRCRGNGRSPRRRDSACSARSSAAWTRLGVPTPIVSAMPQWSTPISLIRRTTRSTSSALTSPWYGQPSATRDRAAHLDALALAPQRRPGGSARCSRRSSS